MDCVIYARVSTKEQQDEGYSIPAQLKAIRAFCDAEGLSRVAEFIEAESAGHSGRTQFGRMLAFFGDNPECRIVVAHKLDRLYRNFSDQVSLEEELGVRARYVVGDVPYTPQGELSRDVQLSVAKYYLGNLREEVKKGMEEKVAQGGWPHRAPFGYLNDKGTRCLVVDHVRAPLIRHAFERYASGAVSVRDLTEELFSLGLRQNSGRKVVTSVVHEMLSNPIYCGRIPYKGNVYPGAHESIISVDLFESVQAQKARNRNGTTVRRREYPLRGLMRCKECGCLITAGAAKGHTYYRCTHGKGKGSCSQSAYIREEALMAQVEEILGSIEIGPEVLEALVADCEALLEEKRAELAPDVSAAESELSGLKTRERKW